MEICGINMFKHVFNLQKKRIYKSFTITITENSNVIWYETTSNIDFTIFHYPNYK